MSQDLIAAMRAADKLATSALQRAKENQPDVKPNPGIFEGRVKKFELAMISDKLAIRRKFLIVKESQAKYNGYPIGDLMFLSSDRAIGFALNSMISFGVTKVYTTYAEKKTKAFEIFLNEINKMKDLFAFDLSYNDSGYANIKLLRKIETSEPVEETPIEEVVPESISEDITLSDDTVTETEPMVDDFAEDFETSEEKKPDFYDDKDPSIPDIPGLEEDTIPGPSIDAFEVYKKELQLFAFAHDVEIPNLKTLAAEEVVDQLKTRCTTGFKKSDLAKKEKTLLKNVGLMELMK